MNIFWEELTAGLTSPDQLLRIFLRLCVAILLGAVLGLQRVSARKPSGLRTHSLVCLATTVLLLAYSSAGLSHEGASRIIQGIVTGIGFIGAGSILKLSEEHLIHGLTVSIRIWTTAAVGVAIGLGQVGIALVATVLISLVLALFAVLERRGEKRPRSLANS
ncbi:MAG: MgtC/SapB family protein [Chthoniobacterales bacterium]